MRKQLNKALSLFLAALFTLGLLPTAYLPVMSAAAEGIILAPGCECETLCDHADPNPDCEVCFVDPHSCAFYICDCTVQCSHDAANLDCAVCADDIHSCAVYIVCECIDPCDPDNPNEECPVCAVNPAICTPFLMGQIDPMSKSGGRNGTAPTVDTNSTFTDTVNLFTMYEEAYMNFIVYAYDYPSDNQ